MVMKVLDTYALWEISQGNPKFSHYLEEDFVITDILLAEFYGILLREYNELTANYWLEKLQNYSQSTELYILIKAIKFRRKYVKKNLSFFDAAGYIYALENNYKFVTGDKEFRDMPGVEFAQK